MPLDRNLRFAFRLMRRQSAASALAVAVLALGIASTSGTRGAAARGARARQCGPAGVGGGAGLRHLDSNVLRHHDAGMRTTVTLDADVERELREEMHRRRESFKQSLNRLLRTGLAASAPPARERFVVRARPMGLRPGIDPTRMNQLADELEAEAAVARMRAAEAAERKRQGRRG